MTEPIKVMIVDDHPVVRNGLRMSLADKPDMTIVGEAADGLEAEKTALEMKPDVILMDISMPRRGGFETLVLIKQQLPQVKVLIMTISEQDADLLQAVRLGADGYLLKTSTMEQINDAIRRVARGESILSAAMTAKLMDELRKKTSGPLLSGRESEILDLLGEGLTTSQIARRLYLGAGTVGTYVRRLQDKLQLRNRAEAIAYAARHKSTRT